MVFDIEQVLRDMAKTTADITKKKGKKAIANVDAFFESRKDRLNRLVARLRDQKIDQETYLKFLDEEKELLKMELVSQKVAAKATAQAAVNGIFKVLEDAIEAALGL